MADLNLACGCGKVKAIARDVGPSLGNRIVCYCESCQKFPIKLDKADLVLDEYGGTEIYQIPPAHLEVVEGADQLRCLKHSEKGLHRFYAGCCDHPIANAPGTGIPFIGVIHSSYAEPGKSHELLGPIRCHTFTEGATNPLPEDRKSTMALFLVRVIAQILTWRLRGLAKPHPFFHDDGRCIVDPAVR